MSQPGVVASRRGTPTQIWAWCMYDWAQSAYSTLQITVVFFYLTKVALPEIGGPFYSYGISLTTLCAAFLSPTLGALADAHASKRFWLWCTTVPSVLAAGAIALLPEGWGWLVGLLFIVMNLGYEVSQGFYNAFLTELTDESTIDGVSAQGFAWGYVGGGTALALSLLVLLRGDLLGLPSDARYDAHATGEATFVVEVPNGNYQVRIESGDMRQPRDAMRFTLNGTAFDPLDTAAGEVRRLERALPVTDGRIALALVDGGGADPWAVINRLELRAADSTTEVRFDFGSRSSPNDAGCVWVAPSDRFDVRSLQERFKSAEGLAPPPAELRFGWESGEVRAIDRVGPMRLRVGMGVLAVWWGVFSLPALWLLRDRGPAKAPRESAIQSSVRAVRQVATTLGHVRRFGTLFVFLIAYLTYNDGIQTIITQASPFATTVLNVGERELIPVILMIQFVALPGALGVGWLSKRWGHKPTLLGCLAIYVGWLLTAFFINQMWHLWALGALLALVMGGSQSVSRSMMALMTPPRRAAEFFGFFSFAGKATSTLGPALFASVLCGVGGVVGARLAILSLLVFFVVGMGLLMAINVERGKHEARAAEEEAPRPSDAVA